MTNPRVPPNNTDAERYLLSGLLGDPTQETLDTVARVLRPEHWYDPAHRKIYEAAQALSSEGVRPDAATVATWLQERGLLQDCGGTVLLARLVDETPAKADGPEKLANVIVNHYRMRQLIAVGQWIVSEGYEYQASVDEFVAAAEGRVAAAGANTSREDTAASARDVASECIASAGAKSRGEKPRGIPWGIPGLNRLLGPKTDGDIYIVAGRPGMGKTGFVIQDARSVARSEAERRGVAFVSLEMPHEQIGYRAIAQESGVDGRRFSEGRLEGEEWGSIAAAGGEFAQLPIYFDDGPRQTVSQIRGFLRRAIREWRRTHPGVELAQLVIDHLQFVGYGDIPREKRANDNTIIGAIMGALKALAKEFRIPIVLVCHLNRECDKRPNRRPQMSDLRDSGSIEQDATGVLFIYREDHYTDGDSDPEDKGVAEILCRKGRNAGTFTHRVKFIAPCVSFAPLERIDYGGDEVDAYCDFEDGASMGLPRDYKQAAGGDS